MAEIRYTKDHEYIRVEGAEGVVGISDHAQRELTDIVYVELPPVGDRVEAGKECAVVESVKAASDIYSPVTGDVVAVNEELSRTPELVNQDPYGKGWIFKVKMSDLPELGELMTPNDYAAHIGA